MSTTFFILLQNWRLHSEIIYLEYPRICANSSCFNRWAKVSSPAPIMRSEVITRRYSGHVLRETHLQHRKIQTIFRLVHRDALKRINKSLL